jgi:hypothetical protein
MANGNPFYIQPGGDFSQGLAGLSDTVNAYGERKRAEEKELAAIAKLKKLRQGALEAYQTGDPNAAMEYSILNPEMAGVMKNAIASKNKITEDNLRDLMFDIVLDPTEENVDKLIKARQALLKTQGVTSESSKETDGFMEKFKTDPEKTRKDVSMSLAFMYPDKWKAYREAVGEGKAGEDDTKPVTYSKKNPDGSTRTINDVIPNSAYAQELIADGFVRGAQTTGRQTTAQERKDAKVGANVDKLKRMALADPNKFFENESYRMNDDGSLYIDPVTLLPTELVPFYTATGKRSNIKAMQELGSQLDDAKELHELLALPSVSTNLNKANSEGLWDKATGKWKNSIAKWLQGQGISGDSATATAIARIQRLTSQERKKFMGTAVTETEIVSAIPWMPSAGDTYEAIVNKTRLMGLEAEDELIQWIDMFSKTADMSPFYKAFGLKRFGYVKDDKSKYVAPEKGGAPKPTPEALDYLRKNPASKDYFKKTYGYLPEGE